MSVEFRGLTFAVELNNDGLKVVVTGEMPDPPVTQAEIDVVRSMLNAAEDITVTGDLVTQVGTFREVSPVLMNVGLAPIWEAVEQPELG